MAVGSGLCALNKMLFKRSARTIGIEMEFKQSLGQTSIIHSLLAKQSGYNLLVFASVEQCGYILSVKGLAHCVKLGIESEVRQALEEVGHSTSLGRLVGLGIKEFKKRFKHT